MRIHVGMMALVGCALAAGCGEDTVLRLTVLPGSLPHPSALRVTVTGFGVTAAPLRVAPVTLPGTVVVRGLPASTPQVCVRVEGLDAADGTISDGSVPVPLRAHATVTADVTLGGPTGDALCGGVGPDLGLPPPDLGGDGGVAICPAGATFCDDFESGDTARWTVVNIKHDLGSEVRVQSARVYHGANALELIGSGAAGNENQVSVERDFPALAPPFAVRAMFYSVPDLDHYTIVMSIYDNITHGFAFGGDNNAHWAITEDQTTTGAPDRNSNTTATGGAWHCVELVVDAAGSFTGYVDNTALLGPFPRFTQGIAYSNLSIGIDRTVVTTGSHLFVDDVAMGPARLYCP